MWSRNDAEGGRLSAPALPNHADGAVLAWVSPASMPASDDLSQPASLRHKHGVAGDDFQTRLAPRIPCSGSHFGISAFTVSTLMPGDPEFAGRALGDDLESRSRKLPEGSVGSRAAAGAAR